MGGRARLHLFVKQSRKTGVVEHDEAVDCADSERSDYKDLPELNHSVHRKS